MFQADGPYFDDLSPGQVLPRAPTITIGQGETALYQAVCGDPLPVSLAGPLSVAIAGAGPTVVNPTLVLQMAIGQSTVATRNVIANLFYRDLYLRKVVRVGDSLTTTVTIRGLREATRRPDRAARGLALLGIATVDQSDEAVADFERCALLPIRDHANPTAAEDDLGSAASEVDIGAATAAVPAEWDLSALGEPDAWALHETRVDPMRDTVSDALALVRLTQNQAAAHRDPSRGQGGRRLVYGGHTIGLAQASLGRLLPSMATMIGWVSCDHVAPVFEGDVVGCAATLEAIRPVTGGRLLVFRVLAETQGDEGATPVLDYRPVVYAP